MTGRGRLHNQGKVDAPFDRLPTRICVELRSTTEVLIQAWISVWCSVTKLWRDSEPTEYFAPPDIKHSLIYGCTPAEMVPYAERGRLYQINMVAHILVADVV